MLSDFALASISTLSRFSIWLLFGFDVILVGFGLDFGLTSVGFGLIWLDFGSIILVIAVTALQEVLGLARTS